MLCMQKEKSSMKQLDKIYSKQFLITNKICDKLKNWNKLKIGEHIVYMHNSLNYSSSENNANKIIIIGDVFDYRFPYKTNQNISDELNENSRSIESAITLTYSLSGTFLVLYFNFKDNLFQLFGDFAMQRELYYLSNSDNMLVLGSSPNIIQEVVSINQSNTKDEESFFNSSAFNKRKAYILNETNFEGLLRLKPNHYLNVNKNKIIRYFPNKKNKKDTLENAAKKAANMLQNYILAAHKRYPMLIPISAGWDSRVFLAASKNIRKEVRYYVLQTQNKSTEHYEIKIPKVLMELLNLPFEIIDYSKKIDTNEHDIIKKSMWYSDLEHFEYIINYFYKNYPNHITLNGNISEVARLEFDEVYNLTPKKISFIQKYPFLDYALKRYTKWHQQNKELFSKYEFRTLDMLYWEENCANWVAKTKSEFRVFGIEVFSPFNSRELMMTLMSVDKKYRRKQNPILYKKIIEELWPEVLQVPVNSGMKKKAMRITQKLGIFSFLRNLKLSFYLFLGRNKW